MKLVVETENNAEKALFVSKEKSALLDALQKALKQYDISSSRTSDVPYSFSDISYMFVIQDSFKKEDLQQLFNAHETKIVLIPSEKSSFTQLSELLDENGLSHVKVLRMLPTQDDPEDIEKALWFMLSQSNENALNLVRTLQPKERHAEKTSWIPDITITRGKITAAVLFLLFAMHTLFVVPLIGTGYYVYEAARSLQDQQFETAHDQLDTAQSYFAATKGTYSLAKPGLQFLFLSVVPDNLISIEENALSFVESGLRSAENAQMLARLFLLEDKTPEQISQTQHIVEQLEHDVLVLERSGQNIYDKLDYDIDAVQDVRDELGRLNTYLRTGSSLVSHLDSFLAQGEAKNYIVFFYNNMEIRPGGGFIGSFAHVQVENYTLKNFHVYDVYDADGQLTQHIRPPKAIREYLDQPNWFLRDSNFTPDFQQNVQTAEFFLEEELGLTDFDGAVAVTTTALTYLLDAFGEVYIADFDETITADNFYIKAQTQSEFDFFPGSTQKKSFLSTVGRTLLLKLEQASPAQLGLAIKRALDEKHIVILTDDTQAQQNLDVLGWSGKLLQPQCIDQSSHCVINHMMSVDANLGVNKANYFVNKLMKLRTEFNEDGIPYNELSVSYTNNSADDVFPGGIYKNYAQIYIPHNVDVHSVDINGKSVQKYDTQVTGLFTIIGTYLEIPPQETSVVTVSYTLSDRIKQGQNAYQVVFQKQIGSFSSDFSLDIVYPDSMIVTGKNFKTVAKNNSVFYNSTLETNKVFVIEFLQQ